MHRCIVYCIYAIYHYDAIMMSIQPKNLCKRLNTICTISYNYIIKILYIYSGHFPLGIYLYNMSVA